VDLQLTNQCNNAVQQIDLREALELGTSPCTLMPPPLTDQITGIYSFTCQYPGLDSPEAKCEASLKGGLSTFTDQSGHVKGAAEAVPAVLEALAKRIPALIPAVILAGLVGVSEGVVAVFAAVGLLVDLITDLTPEAIAAKVCPLLNPSQPMSLTLNIAGGPSNLGTFISAPLAPVSKSLTINDPNQTADCSTCPTPLRRRDLNTGGNWDLPCNVLQNPAFDTYDNDTNNLIGLEPWGLQSYGNFWFGTGGEDGTLGCASGQPGDRCM
jgi:hypothetical protein